MERDKAFEATRNIKSYNNRPTRSMPIQDHSLDDKRSRLCDHNNGTRRHRHDPQRPRTASLPHNLYKTLPPR
ncbi:hypothetical protein Ptr902_06857 [Pyrenophora tritici-repentis]|nr:hypothetical protein Ptr902_06857 [Pyrenophora tritici-repentis]